MAVAGRRLLGPPVPSSLQVRNATAAIGSMSPAKPSGCLPVPLAIQIGQGPPRSSLPVRAFPQRQKTAGQSCFLLMAPGTPEASNAVPRVSSALLSSCCFVSTNCYYYALLLSTSLTVSSNVSFMLLSLSLPP